MKTIVTKYDSPIGTLYITATDKIEAISVKKPKNFDQEKSSLLTKKITKFLDQYFSNKNPDIRQISSMLNFDQGTSFQKKVWKELSKISFGESKTYGEIAKAVKSPKASRAVGAAVGKNPFLILLPCHRVLGSNKAITGFSAGINKKIKLLNHENLDFKR